MRSLKRSIYKNKLICACGPLRGTPTEIDFCMLALKKSYTEMDVDFYRRRQLQSACNLAGVSYRKIVFKKHDFYCTDLSKCH
jgi:hypothetical protein